MPRLTDLIQADPGVVSLRNQSAPPRDPSDTRTENTISYRSLEEASKRPMKESDSGECPTDVYHLAEAAVARIRAAVREGTPVDIQPVKDAAARLAESLLQDDHLLTRAVSAQVGASIITNMVNVAIVSTKMAIGMGWPRKDLEEMTLAGLIHDIGMFRLPDSLVDKSGSFTPEEDALVRQHPELGCAMVRGFGAEYEWLAQSILQEHERSQGNGYPRGLKDNQIIEYAGIIGLADVFDTLLSGRRHSQRLHPHEAMREILITEKRSFPSHIIDVLVEEIGPFPVGTVVRLNTGEVCIVKQLTGGHPLQPLVEVRSASEADHETRLLDLTRLPRVCIVEALEPAGLPSL